MSIEAIVDPRATFLPTLQTIEAQYDESVNAIESFVTWRGRVSAIRKMQSLMDVARQRAERKEHLRDAELLVCMHRDMQSLQGGCDKPEGKEPRKRW